MWLGRSSDMRLFQVTPWAGKHFLAVGGPYSAPAYQQIFRASYNGQMKSSSSSSPSCKALIREDQLNWQFSQRISNNLKLLVVQA